MWSSSVANALESAPGGSADLEATVLGIGSRAGRVADRFTHCLLVLSNFVALVALVECRAAVAGPGHQSLAGIQGRQHGPAAISGPRLVDSAS